MKQEKLSKLTVILIKEYAMKSHRFKIYSDLASEKAKINGLI